MYEITKAVFYKEKRNVASGKVEFDQNGIISEITVPELSEEKLESLLKSTLTSHGIEVMDVILERASVKIIDSSVVVKLYENESGEQASEEELESFGKGDIDLFLGCYKYDIQKVQRENVEIGSLFTPI